MTHPTRSARATASTLTVSRLARVSLALSIFSCSLAAAGCAGGGAATLVPEPGQPSRVAVDEATTPRLQGHTRVERTIIESSATQTAAQPTTIPALPAIRPSVELDVAHELVRDEDGFVITLTNRGEEETHFASRLFVERSTDGTFARLGDSPESGTMLARVDGADVADCASLVPGGLIELRLDPASEHMAAGEYRIVATDCTGRERVESAAFSW